MLLAQDDTTRLEVSVVDEPHCRSTPQDGVLEIGETTT